MMKTSSTQAVNASKTKYHNVTISQTGEVEDELLSAHYTRSINKQKGLDNEAVTLTDIADGPPDADKQKVLNAHQSHIDNNEVEMHHCSVGQSTAFGGREDYDLHTNSRFNFMGDIAMPRGSVPIHNYQDQALREELNDYQI